MEEIIRNLKYFVEERNTLQAQINEAENKRNKLAEERNAKKTINKIKNDEETWSEIKCLGRQISDLGNQSQWFQNQIYTKYVSVKNQVYIEIDSFIAEEVRKARIINEQIEENENCSGDLNTIYEQKKQINEIEEDIDNLVILKKMVRHGRIDEIISEYEEIAGVEEQEEKRFLNEISLDDIEAIFSDIKQENFENKIVEFIPQTDEFEVEEFETDEEPFEVEEFDEKIEPINVEEIQVEEFKNEASELKNEELSIENLNVEEFKDDDEPEIEDLVVEEFNRIVENANKPDENNTKIEEYSDIEQEIIKELEQQLSKEKEIIAFEENKNEKVENIVTDENTKIQNIDVKIEDKTLVYKAQISDGTTMKIYPIKEKKLETEKADRKLWKEDVVGYAAREYKNYDNGAVRKMDPIVCEILERFAIKYNQNPESLIYNYVMSFSNVIDIALDSLPQITYNLSFIDDSKISSKDKKTLQKIVKNSVKNSLVETIGNVTTGERIKYYIKKIFNLNTTKALTNGNRE